MHSHILILFLSLFLDLEKQIGLSREQQAERLRARLARRAELIAQREEQGLSTDEAILEGLLDGEEETDRVENKGRVR